MGTMKVELFKDIIDQAVGNVEFISLASEEPLVAKDFDKMIQYTNDKFLNLKINTNIITNRKKMSLNVIKWCKNLGIFSRCSW